MIDSSYSAGPPTRPLYGSTSAPPEAERTTTRDDEAGCIVYCFAADPCRDDLIQVYELWESEEALLAHFAHPNYHAMRTMLNEGGLAGAVSRKHRIDASAPVYGPDRTPSPAFD